MNQATALALNAINRAFYSDLADEFSVTRDAPWPGWLRLLSALERHYPLAELDVLDIGCGNGRFATFLAENLPRRRNQTRYLGLDASPAMLERAGARSLPLAGTEYGLWDIVEERLGDRLANRDFSLIVLFGVLHHVPGAARRRELVADATRLLRPGGLLAFTSWQFEAFERFRAKTIPWEEFNRLSRMAETAQVAIDTDELEPGDRLLPWGDSGRVVRYCHFADEEETQRLASGLPLELAESYRADGREGNLNRYFIYRRLTTNPT